MAANLQRGAIVGAAVLAAHELAARGVRSSDARPVQSPAEAKARARLDVPCGARRAGELGESFLAEYELERAALGAEYGAIATPLLSAECCVEWADVWLRAFAEAHGGDHYRFRVFKAGDTDSEGAIDPFEHYGVAQPVLGGGFLGRLERSALGNTWWNLVAERKRAQRAIGDSPIYVHCRAIAERLRELAVAMDDAARSGGRPDHAVVGAVKQLPGAAKGIVRGVGDAVAWTIEELVGPLVGTAAAATVGAVASNLAPYLIVGGVAYYVVRRRR